MTTVLLTQWFMFSFILIIRILAQGDFSSDFHTFGLERRPDVMRFFVDGNLVGEIRPPAGGFWELGNFASNPGGPNIWASGSNMAPFDQPVSYIIHRCLLFQVE